MSVSIDSLTVGDVIAERDYHFDRDTLIRYSGASGDFNPIHYRDVIAKEVGLPDVIAHGMLTMGVSVQCVTDWLDDPTKIVDYGVRFTRPIVVDPKAGADVHVVARVGTVDLEAGTARIDLTTTFEGQTVLGKAQVVVTLA